MNIALWTLQGILALHTVVGAVWKFSNSEQVVPSLKAIPHGLWLAMGVLELICAVGLILPAFFEPLAILAPVAAVCIGSGMLVFCAVDRYSKVPNTGHVIYWLVVAAVCAFIAYGRLARSPL